MQPATDWELAAADDAVKFTADLVDGLDLHAGHGEAFGEGFG
jgi:hypothetical protein